MKYNYVIFGSDEQMYRISYYDLESVPYARYLWKPIDTDNVLLINLYRLHSSPIINKYIKLPGKSIWDKWQFRGKFDNDRPICFVFFASRKKILNTKFLKYLKRTYHNCKLVIFFQDLVAQSLKDKFDEIADMFDLKLSFDQADAKKYEMIYHPLVYSKIEIPIDTYIEPCNVYFLGKAKNRLSEILNAYKVLNKAGLKCDFYISGVAPAHQIKYDNVHYIDSMTYIDNLRHVLSADYLLEIMQKNGHGFTIRYCEAIMYGKRMITNNPEIHKAPFYSSDKIITFKNNLDECVSQIICPCDDIEYGYKENLSPIKLLDFIDDVLE